MTDSPAIETDEDIEEVSVPDELEMPTPPEVVEDPEPELEPEVAVQNVQIERLNGVRISPGSGEYDRLGRIWTVAGRPTRFTVGNQKYMALNDNGAMHFVLDGPQMGDSSKYADNSFE